MKTSRLATRSVLAAIDGDRQQTMSELDRVLELGDPRKRVFDQIKNQFEGYPQELQNLGIEVSVRLDYVECEPGQTVDDLATTFDLTVFKNRFDEAPAEVQAVIGQSDLGDIDCDELPYILGCLETRS